MDEWKRDPAAKEEREPTGWMQTLQKLGKKELFLVAIILMGMAALLWSQSSENSEKNLAEETRKNIAGLEDTRSQLAAEVQQILSGIEGIGKVEVCLTLSSDGIREYAFNQTEETRENSEPSQSGSGTRQEKTASISTDVAVSGGNALLVENHYPQVVGVLVVAEGADNAVMQQKICDAVAVLLNISPHRVRVLAGTEEKP